MDPANNPVNYLDPLFVNVSDLSKLRSCIMQAIMHQLYLVCVPSLARRQLVEWTKF